MINFKEAINEEVKSLVKLKEQKVLNIEDDLHTYSRVKRMLIGKYSEKEINSKIKRKKVILKRKKDNTIAKYNKSIEAVRNFESKNFFIFLIQKPFRRLFIINFISNILKILNENKLMILIFLISIIAGIIKPIFFSKYNMLNNILKNNVTIGLMAVGMTFVILTGGIDLSVGSILGLSGIVSMGLIVNGVGTGWSFLIGFIIASTIGILQGLLISFIKLPPFIVTLVGLLSIRGGVYIYAHGQPKTDINNSFLISLNSDSFLGIPILVLVLFIFTILGILILKYTSFGRKVLSVGGNEEASKMSGINTKKIILFCYLISGLMAGIASMSFASQILSVGPTSGNSYELDVIAAVVLGGTSLSGGKGGVGKTFLGWLVISILGNALIILGFDSNYQLVFKGMVILLAVILDKNLNLIKRIKLVKNKFFN